MRLRRPLVREVRLLSTRKFEILGKSMQHASNLKIQSGIVMCRTWPLIPCAPSWAARQDIILRHGEADVRVVSFRTESSFPCLFFIQVSDGFELAPKKRTECSQP